MKIDERTRLEITSQPESLRNTIDGERKKVERIAKKIAKNQSISTMYIVAMGSSYSAALTARTFAVAATSLAVEIYRGYELEYERPHNLGKESCVVAISFSGETEDVVSGLRFARKQGAYTISISGPEDNTIAREADDSIRIISPDTKAMVAAYLSQVAILYMLFGFIGKYRDRTTKVDRLNSELDSLIPRLAEVIADQEAEAMKLAKKFAHDSLFYVISAGPNYGLAYKSSR